MNWYQDGNGGMGGAGIITMAVIWILIIGLGVWLVTWLTRRDKSVSQNESPRQILDRRLAAGEIDAATYAQGRRLIEGRLTDEVEVK